VCGKLVCSNCYIIYKGEQYCTKSCIPPTLSNTKSTSILTQNVSTGPKSIGTWAIITLFLFCVAGGSFAIREIRDLREENKELKDSRIHLIKTLKSSNQEIYYLKNKSSTDSIPGKPDVQTTAYLIKNPAAKATIQKDYTLPHASSFSFSNGATDKKLISLTFDGGSDANVALPILDTLRSRNVKVTIFLTGQFIKKFPDIVQVYLSEGHEIGNHTLSHPHLTSYAQDKTQTMLPEITKEFLHNELSKNEELFYSLTGQKMAPFWRAPYGEFNSTLCSWANELGYIHVGWRQGPTWRQGLDSNDWIPNEETPGFKTPAEVLDKILGIAKSNTDALNGGIILMHLGTTRKDPKQQVHTILGSLIDSLQQRGFKIVPVSEMVEQSGFYLASLPSKTHFQEATSR
jgi:peptidoglycan/xylan/chitin deacetylase (PgdA/CDA1 family)